MSRFLLDTNIASFLTKNANAALDYRVSLVPKDDLAISVITEAEMLFGLALLPDEAKMHRTVRSFLDQILILPWKTLPAQRRMRNWLRNNGVQAKCSIRLTP